MQTLEQQKNKENNFGRTRLSSIELPGEVAARSFARRLLSLPVFYKILIANSLIVCAGAFAGTWLTQAVADGRLPNYHIPLALLFVVVGVPISLAINFVVLKAALQPLVMIEKAVEEIRGGNEDARVGRSLSDPLLDLLADTLNTMLDLIAQRNEQLRALSAQVITAQEAERKRIARELHDETAQYLTSLLIHLKLLEKVRVPEELPQRAAELRALVAETMERVRDLARELRPTLLDDLGLVEAVKAKMEQIGERGGLQTEFTAHAFSREERLLPEIELVFYRVVQEALTNTLKHAAATHIIVSLVRTDRQLTLVVKDDGQGFVPEGLPAFVATDATVRGLGLFGMRERAALIGGDLTIESVQGRGTVVTLTAPILGRC